MTPAQTAPADAPTIVVSGLGKAYALHHSPRSRLRTLLTGRSSIPAHWSLKDVSFSLHRGQALGLVGNNGAGKSTLLKLLASSVQPTAGSVQVDGRLTAILELGAGFHPDFTGRQNLFFAGSLIGLGHADIERLLPEIVAFSELEAALDRPVKTYSSGMVVRLAFALVTAVEPDVLIIDEALAVGDQRFQKKCIDRITAFRERGCTILFCSHSMYHVKQLCDVALWLDAGVTKAFGPTEEVVSAYESHLRSLEAPTAAAGDTGSATALASQREVVSATAAALLACEVAHLGAGDPPLLEHPDLRVCVRARVPEGDAPNFGIMLEQADGRGITAVTTHDEGVAPHRLDDGTWETVVTFTDLPLFTGDYVLSVYLFDHSGLVVYEEWPKCQYFRVLYPSKVPGLVRLPHRWG